MTQCKWWQQEFEFPGEGSCDKPIPRNSKIERRKTGKEYPDVPNKVSCKTCVLNDFIGFGIIVVGVTFIVSLPFFSTKID
jgi:hypothetical protein